MKGTVLVVEDNPVMRRMLRMTLESAGCQVLEAEDGRTALAMVAEHRIDVVTQDLVLPDMDGARLLVQMRELVADRRLPVIALSGLADRLGDAKALGFDQFLIKPVEPSRLLESVGAVISRPHPRLQHSGARVLIVDDNQIQRKLLGLRLEQLGYDVSAVADGQAALEWAGRETADVIVSDVLMPGMDGFMLCRALRHDPSYRTVPVLLTSSAYVEAADRDLARAAGASDLIVRTPQLEDLTAALAACLDSDVPLPEADAALERRHAQRLMRQVECQAALNAELAQRAAAQSVELSVLAGISEVLRRSPEVESVLTEVVQRCTEIAGIEHAAAYLTDSEGSVALIGHVGFAESRGLESFFGCSRLLIDAMVGGEEMYLSSERGTSAEGMNLLAQAGLTSVVVSPLTVGDEDLGALVFATTRCAISDEQRSFTRTVAAQTNQSLALVHALSSLSESKQRTIGRLARAAEFRDNETARRTERVSLYSELISRRYGLEGERCELIRLASLMHDIGKLGVPDSILLKPGRLTGEQRREMERHAECGQRILACEDDDLLDLAATIAWTHHERYDGQGYPRGLAGEDIPLEGRILAIADVFDAVTSDRVYRPAMSLEHALHVMRSGRGGQFDPVLLDLFLALLPEILEIRSRHADDVEAAVDARLAVSL